MSVLTPMANENPPLSGIDAKMKEVYKLDYHNNIIIGSVLWSNGDQLLIQLDGRKIVELWDCKDCHSDTMSAKLSAKNKLLAQAHELMAKAMKL